MGVRRLAVANGRNIFQMLLVKESYYYYHYFYYRVIFVRRIVFIYAEFRGPRHTKFW